MATESNIRMRRLFQNSDAVNMTYAYTLSHKTTKVLLNQSYEAFPYLLHEFACAVPSSNFSSATWNFDGKTYEPIVRGSGKAGKMVVTNNGVYRLPKHDYKLSSNGVLTMSLSYEGTPDFSACENKVAAALRGAFFGRSQWTVNERSGDGGKTINQDVFFRVYHAPLKEMKNAEENTSPVSITFVNVNVAEVLQGSSIRSLEAVKQAKNQRSFDNTGTKQRTTKFLQSFNKGNYEVNVTVAAIQTLNEALILTNDTPKYNIEVKLDTDKLGLREKYQGTNAHLTATLPSHKDTAVIIDTALQSLFVDSQ